MNLSYSDEWIPETNIRNSISENHEPKNSSPFSTVKFKNTSDWTMHSKAQQKRVWLAKIFNAVNHA